MINYETISDIEPVQIEAINEFLKAHNLSGFSTAELELLRNLESLDLLGMAQCCGTIKGYVADLSDCSVLRKNEDGFTFDQIMQEYKSSLNEEDYEPSDLAEMVADKQAETKAEIVAYGIFLGTNKEAEADVLFLNADLTPIYIDYVRF